MYVYDENEVAQEVLKWDACISQATRDVNAVIIVHLYRGNKRYFLKSCST